MGIDPDEGLVPKVEAAFALEMGAVLGGSPVCAVCCMLGGSSGADLEASTALGPTGWGSVSGAW